MSKMDKKKFLHVWHYIRRIHPWYFLAIAIIAGAINILSLRHNNLQMVALREAVYAADKAGDQVKIESSLYNLRVYVYNHMNTSLTSGTDSVHPPIQLQYTYERAQAAQQTLLGQNNAGLYHEAQQSCSAQQATSGAEAIACIETYVSAHGVQLSAIPDGMYKFDFVSAKWSPDLAGWSLVVTAISLITFALSASYRWWAKRNL